MIQLTGQPPFPKKELAREYHGAHDANERQRGEADLGAAHEVAEQGAAPRQERRRPECRAERFQQEHGACTLRQRDGREVAHVQVAEGQLQGQGVVIEDEAYAEHDDGNPEEGENEHQRPEERHEDHAFAAVDDMGQDRIAIEVESGFLNL